MEKKTESWSAVSGGKGVLELLRKDGKTLFRFQVAIEGVHKGKEKETPLKQTLLMVADGENVSQLAESGENRGGRKSRIQPVQLAQMGGVSGKELFDALHASDLQLKLLPEEKVGDTDCFVLEAVTKNGALTRLFYFSKELGCVIQFVERAERESRWASYTLSDVKPNVEVPEDRFVFTFPEGVEVVDMTGARRIPVDVRPGQPPAEPQPGEPAKPAEPDKPAEPENPAEPSTP